MREKTKLIIIMGLAAMSAASLFIGQRTYSLKKAMELEINGLRNENETLSGKLEEVSRERKQLQEKIKALSNDLEKASQEKKDIQRQYELLVKERDDLVEKAKTLQKNNEQLSGDLSNLTREKQRLGQRLEDDLAPLMYQNAQLKQQLDNLNSLKSKLEFELGQLKGEKSDFQRKLNEIDSFLEQRLATQEHNSLREEIDAIRSGTQAGEEAEKETEQPKKEFIELPTIVVLPQTQTETSTWLPIKPMGTVLEINRENRFAIIDLGQDVGIKLGDTLKVYRQDTPIATIEIIQVRQSISACDIKEEITAIEVGDIVR